MKNQKSQSGITLIALVITIVVLLILAGITVTYLVSDNGIFNSANQASDATVAGQISDYITTAQGGLQTAFYNPYTPEDEKTFKTDTVGFMQSFFPTDYVVAGTGTGLKVDENLPKFTGSMKVTVGGKDYNVSFDGNGKATVALPE